MTGRNCDGFCNSYLSFPFSGLAFLFSILLFFILGTCKNTTILQLHSNLSKRLCVNSTTKPKLHEMTMRMMAVVVITMMMKLSWPSGVSLGSCDSGELCCDPCPSRLSSGGRSSLSPSHLPPHRQTNKCAATLSCLRIFFLRHLLLLLSRMVVCFFSLAEMS